MNGLARAALVAAAGTSLIAVGDAVVLGVTGDNLVDDASARWWAGTTDLVHALTFGLLAAVLVGSADIVDAASRFRRVLRWLLTGALAVLAAGYGVTTVTGTPPAALVAPVGACFALMFVLGAVLGASHLRRPGTAAAGWLMAAPLLLLPAAVGVSAVSPRWGHPGWAEASLYVGIALLGRGLGGGSRAEEGEDRQDPAVAARVRE